jgi:formylglycine-generating enzyme required for sulfatase activity
LISSDTAMSILATQTLYARWKEDDPLYCVIDISAGENAASYPVTYLSDVPAGGWTDEYKTTKLVLRRIEPGSFKMNGAYDVTITKAFYCGVFEVTQKQYELVTGSKPSNFSGDKLPVEKVSWNTIRGNSDTYNWPTIKTVDPNSFIGRIQARTGLNFDLPTEAQWEYACRAGTTTTYYWGDSMDGAYAWYSGNSSSKTHIVGTRMPNEWGLYDMSGNVWEWCLDWYDVISNSNGPDSGIYRILRGGGFCHDDYICNSNFRDVKSEPYGSHWCGGFRLVGNLSE